VARRRVGPRHCSLHGIGPIPSNKTAAADAQGRASDGRRSTSAYEKDRLAFEESFLETPSLFSQLPLEQGRVGADHDDVRLELPHHATLVSVIPSKGAELESSGKTVLRLSAV
jgi:hypothetical protein